MGIASNQGYIKYAIPAGGFCPGEGVFCVSLARRPLLADRNRREQRCGIIHWENVFNSTRGGKCVLCRKTEEGVNAFPIRKKGRKEICCSYDYGSSGILLFFPFFFLAPLIFRSAVFSGAAC